MNTFDWCPDCGSDVHFEVVPPNARGSVWQALWSGARSRHREPTMADFLNYGKHAEKRKAKGDEHE